VIYVSLEKKFIGRQSEPDLFLAARFMVGAGIGIPVASLCINRRLYYISRCNSVTVSRKEVRQLP